MGFISPTCSLIHITHDMIMTWWQPYCIRRIGLFKPQVPMFMIGKCTFRIISIPWERPLLCSIWKSRCFIIIFTHTPTPTQGKLLHNGNPFFPQGIWPRLKNQSDPRRWFPHQIPAALIFLGLRVIIWQFIKCWSSSISPSWFPLQTRL